MALFTEIFQKISSGFQLFTSTDFGRIAVGTVICGESLVKYELDEEHIVITHNPKSVQLIEHLELYETEKQWNL